ncbi:LysR family transcriptional regulator [Flavisphingomonas formosensis]|uniref:LysR family transcriptional regulator n=1 Tax=Flavisphingomonas formosensis TaxID=861534 RepID=UPI0012FB3FCE|nr:LysR family transcriptional regulator [Sphingomonas formosensis]
MALSERALRYFLAVAQHGSFTRAAEASAVVQSAISHQIRAIELEYGVELFRRDGRAVTLAPAGAMLLDYAQSVVGLIDRAGQDLGRFAEGHFGRLRVGFQSAASRQPIVAEALRRFRETNGDADLELSASTGLSMIAAIVEEKLDGAFMYAEADMGLDRIVVTRHDWILALPSSHPLARRRSLLLSDLAEEAFIWLPRAVNPGLHDRMLACCADRKMSPRIQQEAFDESMVLNLVAVGVGIAFVLDSLPAHFNANVVLRRVADFSVPVELCFLTSGKNPNRLLRQFSEMIVEARERSGGGELG